MKMDSELKIELTTDGIPVVTIDQTWGDNAPHVTCGQCGDDRIAWFRLEKTNETTLQNIVCLYCLDCDDAKILADVVEVVPRNKLRYDVEGKITTSLEDIQELQRPWGCKSVTFGEVRRYYSGDEDDGYSVGPEFRIAGYNCSLCQGYTKRYVLIDQKGQNQTNNRGLKKSTVRDLWVVCDECVSSCDHFHAVKRDAETYGDENDESGTNDTCDHFTAVVKLLNSTQTA